MMTMEELLDHMTKKVKTECEEAHRQIVFSLNGTAGLAILRGKVSQDDFLAANKIVHSV